MTAPVNLAEALASASLANRNPTWREYEAAAPCDQRAIIKRWWAIAHGDDRETGNQAWFNWHRAVLGCFHADDPEALRSKRTIGQGCAPSYHHGIDGEDSEYEGV